MMMEAVRTSEMSVDNHFTRQYNPEDNSEHDTRRRENLKSHKFTVFVFSRALISILAVGSTGNSDELVGNFVFWGWRHVSRGA
jgi:hypothetical protein